MGARTSAATRGTVPRLQRLSSTTGGGVALGAGTIAATFAAETMEVSGGGGVGGEVGAVKVAR